MCEMEHYGNCDPETRGKRYCIFHRPGKKGEEARLFYRKLMERLKPKVEEIIVDGRRMRRYVYDVVDCRGYVFPSPPEEFRDMFRYASIWVADFSEAVIEELDFSMSDILIASFNKARIGSIYLTGARISVAYFDNSCVSEIHLSGSEINHISFRGAGIGEIRLSPIDLGFSEILEASYFGLENSLRPALLGAMIKEADFTNARVSSIHLFPKHIREHGDVSDIAEYIASHIDSPETIAQLCSIARGFHEKRGNRDLADKIWAAQRRVLRWRRTEEALRGLRECGKNKGLPRCLGKLSRLLYTRFSGFIEWMLLDLTSDYGVSTRKPLLAWLTALLLVFPALYTLLDGVSGADSFIDHLYFSIATATFMEPGNLYPVGVGKILASIEALFSMFMWTIILLALIRKHVH